MKIRESKLVDEVYSPNILLSKDVIIDTTENLFFQFETLPEVCSHRQTFHIYSSILAI